MIWSNKYSLYIILGVVASTLFVGGAIFQSLNDKKRLEKLRLEEEKSKNDRAAFILQEFAQDCLRHASHSSFSDKRKVYEWLAQKLQEKADALKFS